MFRNSIIKESTSTWSSPITVVPKPEGSIRLCNDFRKLNHVSDFDSYPLPQVDKSSGWGEPDLSPALT